MATVEGEVSRYNTLPIIPRIAFLVLCSLGLILAVLYIFGVVIQGKVILDVTYYFLLMAVFLPCAFLILPARRKDRSPPWYDYIAAVIAAVLCVYFSTHSFEMTQVGWRHPTPLNFAGGFILWLMIMEAGRRVGGLVFLVVLLITGTYPLYAIHMPGVLGGYSVGIVENTGLLVFCSDGLLGMPIRVVGTILLGFLVFAGLLVSTGAGRFFLNVASALLGTIRGGPAKVAVLASGFFGSISGSIFSNIIATGSVTIPAMKRLGYPSHYAGALEACASTGGVLMPPVMGAVAFIMCDIIAVPYRTVIAAATIPAILYYFGLLMQVDAFAAKTGLQGLPKEEVPSFKKTLFEGWHFIVIFLFLLVGLLYLRWEEKAPFYASVLLIVLSYVRRTTWMTPRRLLDALVSVGSLITQTMAIILPIGFIIGGLSATGVAASLTSWIVYLGVGNIFVLLILGMITCYVMGMVGLMSAAYIFLAVTLAPAVIQVAGLNQMATHLFIAYYSMLAAITLPVAGGAFVAAAIAGSNPIKTGFHAMRLGIVIYFIPFFFIFNPALILQGSPLEAFYLFVFCLVGITFIAAGLEGYLLKVGPLRLWLRPPLVVAGFLIAFPEWITAIIGAVLALIIILVSLITKRGEDRPALAV
ncbi:MAG: TRAP transporter permease [Promethearchaeota archaeon]